MDAFYRTLRAIPYRRGPNRWVAGLCGGLSAKFGWDPTLVRIVVLISFLLPFIGVGTYLLAWLLLPWQDGSIPLERAFPGPNSIRR
jgi:phage shock protein C